MTGQLTLIFTWCIYCVNITNTLYHKKWTLVLSRCSFFGQQAVKMSHLWAASLHGWIEVVIHVTGALIIWGTLILSSRLQVGLKSCQNVSISWKCASAYFMTASNAISCPLSLKYICCYEESLKRLVLGCGCHFFNAWNAAAVIQSLSVCQGRQHHLWLKTLNKGLADRWH